jgi:glycerophosphoryl diester phosphodiesterase
MLKIGHRGAKGYEAENTLASFRKAIDMRVDGIELDVHLSADTELVVIHDATIDRTTTGTGFVKNYSAAELKEYQIPTLSDVFDLVDKKCWINVELKGKGTAKAVVELIEKYIREKNWDYNQFIISSFEWNFLEEVDTLNPNIPIGVLTETDIDSAITFAKKINAKAIHPDFTLLTKENTAAMQAQGFLVFPWTVNEWDDIQKMKKYNVNGIITDFPDRI